MSEASFCLRFAGATACQHLIAPLRCCACRLAHLPAEALKQYEHEASHYSVGWSHGKEIFEGAAALAPGASA